MANSIVFDSALRFFALIFFQMQDADDFYINKIFCADLFLFVFFCFFSRLSCSLSLQRRSSKWFMIHLETDQGSDTRNRKQRQKLSILLTLLHFLFALLQSTCHFIYKCIHAHLLYPFENIVLCDRSTHTHTHTLNTTTKTILFDNKWLNIIILNANDLEISKQIIYRKNLSKKGRQKQQ